MWSIKRAADALKSGGVIAYPTEAVYGLGCDPRNETAIHRLLTMKQRPTGKGLILIAANLGQIKPYIALPAAHLRHKIIRHRNETITWIYPRSEETPTWLYGPFEGIAIRLSNHPVATMLCEYFGGAIVSTSANISHQPPARRAEQVRNQFGSSLDYILDAPTGGRHAPSPIRVLLDNRILRKG